jgi:hypothetical protein
MKIQPKRIAKAVERGMATLAASRPMASIA